MGSSLHVMIRGLIIVALGKPIRSTPIAGDIKKKFKKMYEAVKALKNISVQADKADEKHIFGITTVSSCVSSI